MARSLARIERRAHTLKLFAARIDRIKKKDARIVEATQLAAVILDMTEEETSQLSPLERRVARDARNSKRDAPIYLELASKRFEAERKAEVMKSTPIALNAVMVAYVQGNPAQTAQYPVIDVESHSVVPAAQTKDLVTIQKTEDSK